MGNKHFDELDDKIEILEALKYIKSREVEINWVKCEHNLGFGHTVMLAGNLVQEAPEMPSSIVIYTNRNMSDMSIRVKTTLNQITMYDDYIDSMKDNEEIIEIKKLFEGT
jgi:UTP-glucose-1-phosphate uridylyltransferase